MLAYREEAPRQRAGDSTSRRRAQFSFAATAVAIALVALIASADDGFPARNAWATPVATLSDIPSHSHLYRASMIPSPDPIARNRSLAWTLQLRTAAGAPVEGASLALESWMPENGSLTPSPPRAITELGGGFYRVDGLRFDRTGWWNLRLRISAAQTTDSLAFNLIVR